MSNSYNCQVIIKIGGKKKKKEKKNESRKHIKT